MIKGIIVTGAILIFLLLFGAPIFYFFWGYPITVSGKEMKPTLDNNEFIMLDKFTYQNSEPKRGDIVIFKDLAGTQQIKRVVGMPGETISFLNGGVYINDAPLDESYIDKNDITPPGESIREGEHFQIPKDSFYVLNDDRSQFQTDSRTFGPIQKSSILGKYWFKYY